MNDQTFSVFHSFEFNKIIEEVLKKKVEFKSNEDYFYIIHPDKRLKFLKINYCPDPRLECVYGGVLGKQNIIRNLKGLWHITTTPGTNITNYIKQGFYIKERTTSILDLKKSECNLFKNFRRDTKRNIKRGNINGIKIKNTTNLDVYYTILKETYKRSGLNILPKEFYSEILNKLGKLFLAVYNEKIIAGAEFLKFKDKVYYWNGAAHKDYLHLAPNNLIQWKFIKWAKENGFKKYDLLGLDIPSIAEFKEGFGGTRVKFYTLYSKPLYYLKRLKDLFKKNK